ncbi:T3SS (YopN, CesT) and YbjN peptide-binding chaperone 1 [Nocardioides terrisoli]|uniref:T3SS (YopN, CesT) and YbjN peptide-binding chaperone 1 n=1 Tax=Nocardioides terrisoli TaxID=3388267 RepID=UPI00287BBA0D|nr:hypothetical protein [Nocardioides marmorisolisilvae]
MNEIESSEMDAATEEAWAEFERRLGEYVASVPAAAVLTLDVTTWEEDDEGCSPWLQVVRADQAVLLCAPSNQQLAPAHQLDTELEARLLERSFETPGSAVVFEPFEEETTTVWHRALHDDEFGPEEVAPVAVGVLREVFGVIDPTFLEIEGANDGGAWTRLVMSESTTTPPLLRPSSREDLLIMLEPVLEALSEDGVTTDDDGDCWIRLGQAQVCFIARSDRPVIDVMAPLVHDVRSRRQTAVEVAVLNRRRMTKFVLVGRDVLMTMTLPASPFVGEHLELIVPMFLETLDDVADDLALRTGGRR